MYNTDLLVNGINLPDTLYSVRVPMLATYTEEELEIFGIPLDVNDKNKADINTYKNTTVCMMNINRIIDTYLNGYPIGLTNPDEAMILFKTLEAYLNIHVNKIQRSINAPVKQDSRLMEIDKFVTEIFDYNRNAIVKDMVGVGSGFNLNIGLMNTPGTITNNGFNIPSNDDNSSYRGSGITSGYREQQPIYVQPNQINIDIDEVKRKSVIKMGSGITSGYMNN